MFNSTSIGDYHKAMAMTNANGLQVMQAPKSSSGLLVERLELLEKAIESHGQLLNALETRLSLLADPNPTPKDSSGKPPAINIVGRLAHATEDIHSLTGILHDLLQRLHL